MEKSRCKDCQYFIQHYVKWHDDNYVRAGCGHCTHPRLKHRKPSQSACESFKEKTAPDQD